MRWRVSLSRAAAWLRPQALAWARQWHRHGGRPAALALALLAAAALVQWQLRPSLGRDLARLAVRQQALAAVPPGTVATVVAEPPLAQLLPPTAQRGRDLAWLVQAVQAHGLTLERADYSLGASTRGAVSRVEATLPLAGSYAALREFVAAVLNGLPHAALESLQIERPNTQSPQLQATARIVFFYRQEGP